MKKENYDRKQKDPVVYPQTLRNPGEGLDTSCRAGKTMPAAFVYLMPEDTVRGGSYVDIMVQMEETEKMLSNATRLVAHAHFVSFSALPRFDGNDSVAFAWAQKAGAADIVVKHTVDSDIKAFHAAYGEHVSIDDEIWQLPIEAYNTVINHRRKLVSKSLTERTLSDASLARCLWGQTALSRIVPDFDPGLMEASAELTFNGANLPLSGEASIDANDAMYLPANDESIRVLKKDGTEVGGDSIAEDARKWLSLDSAGQYNMPKISDFTNVVAELSGGAGTVSLAAINNAQRTKAFAERRATYAGNPDYFIDLLMRGFEIPNSMYYDPMLIGSARTTIGQMQRYATDSDNLDNYVANGAGALRIPIAMPKQTTGGVIVVTYEITPEPVFDRMAPSILYKDFDDLPNALRDYLDTQPVDIVPNRYVDNLHTSPDGTFGYAPMNHDWTTRRIKMGGRYLRTLASDEDDEDQQHVWSVRTVDPVLDEDTFLVPDDLSHNVFLDTTADPFIVRVISEPRIQGITQFGPSLYESTGDYDAVAEVIPDDFIVPPSAE